ncbi:MAG: hypothetical protein HYZ53_23080 [Planctomycetes bacterium]|nr:hypothetical protein [Planctomycetota bacterium]
MSIDVKCDCGQVATLGDEFAGRRYQCTSCGAILSLPRKSPTVQVQAAGTSAETANPTVAPAGAPPASPLSPSPAQAPTPADAGQVPPAPATAPPYSGIAAIRASGVRPGGRPPKKCPACVELVPVEALTCPNCGIDFATGERPTVHPTAASRLRQSGAMAMGATAIGKKRKPKLPPPGFDELLLGTVLEPFSIAEKLVEAFDHDVICIGAGIFYLLSAAIVIGLELRGGDTRVIEISVEQLSNLGGFVAVLLALLMVLTLQALAMNLSLVVHGSSRNPLSVVLVLAYLSGVATSAHLLCVFGYHTMWPLGFQYLDYLLMPWLGFLVFAMLHRGWGTTLLEAIPPAIVVVLLQQFGTKGIGDSIVRLMKFLGA